MKCFVLAAVAVAALAGCAEDGAVRDACADHGGVRGSNGNTVRQFVTCMDGYFVTVR